jgi:sugar/nucleoside kinase (ribokinase family)
VIKSLISYEKQFNMQKKIGVIGTFIRDTIVTLDGRNVESIGGLYHTLAYLAYLVDPQTWVQPLCHVGEDFYDTIAETLKRFGANIQLDHLYRMPQPNTQVKLIYRTAETRDEITSPPMPPITAAEIAEVADCDAVLVNLITGQDIELEALLALNERNQTPLIYLDLHSLALGIDANGKRYYREIPRWQDWLSAIDILQMNEREAATLAGWGENFTQTELRNFGQHLVGDGLLACHITLASSGSLLFYREGKHICHEYSRSLPIAQVVDVIGCGDAFGAAFLAHFVKNRNFLAATNFANKVAGLNCTFIGSLTPEIYQQLVKPRISNFV